MAKQSDHSAHAFMHETSEPDVSGDDGAPSHEMSARTRFQNYRASVEQRCGRRPRNTERYLPRQPQKIAP